MRTFGATLIRAVDYTPLMAVRVKAGFVEPMLLLRTETLPDDPARFVFVEVYRTPDAPAQHKETPHYAKWRACLIAVVCLPPLWIYMRKTFLRINGLSNSKFRSTY